MVLKSFATTNGLQKVTNCAAEIYRKVVRNQRCPEVPLYRPMIPQVPKRRRMARLQHHRFWTPKKAVPVSKTTVMSNTIDLKATIQKPARQHKNTFENSQICLGRLHGRPKHQAHKIASFYIQTDCFECQARPGDRGHHRAQP